LVQIGVRKGLQVGLGSGMLYGSMFLTYALGFWYGAGLVARAQESGCFADVPANQGISFDLHHSACPTGGDVMTVFFCAVMGSMALGQMAPSLSSFFAARYQRASPDRIVSVGLKSFG
jgi:ATP-binding cassette subfamily B (MDR/TAP) protein 1